MWRREFLKICSGSVTAGVMGAPLLWGFDECLQPGVGARSCRTLVLVELEGGCDWHNTIVPFRSEAYYSQRPNLAIPADQVLRLNESVGMHPSLAPLKRLFDVGELAVVQNVGSPGSHLSHFVARKRWHLPRRAPETGEGWLRRWAALSRQRPFLKSVGCEVPPAMRLLESSSFDCRVTADAEACPGLRGPMMVKGEGSFVQDARRVVQLMRGQPTPGAYHLTLGGFDTHRNQVVPDDPVRGTHSELLRELADGVAALIQGTAAAGLGEDVLLVVFSEFGRSLTQNAELGTDHGNIGHVFFCGKPVRGGVYGSPIVSNRAGGEFRAEQAADLRRTHATILDHWLGTDSRDVLGETLEPFPILRS